MEIDIKGLGWKTILLSILVCILVCFAFFMVHVLIIHNSANDTFREGKHHESRCICKCAEDPQSHRRIYIESPSERGSCTCERVVLPNRPDVETHEDKDTLCDSCDCAYEERNLLKIKISVIIVICVICSLIVYALCTRFTYGCVVPMMEKRAASSGSR